MSGEKCKVSWDNVCMPKDLGDLGIMDLPKFGRALRLRWLWVEWSTDEPPWVGTPIPCYEVDRQMFNATTEIHLGNGTKASFWISKRLAGQVPKEIAPHIFVVSRRKNNKVKEALTGESQTKDQCIQDFNKPKHFQQFVEMWQKIQRVSLVDEQRDEIRWQLTALGKQSAKSAYRLQFESMMARPYRHIIWELWAPPKCKFFAWLIMQNRVWTADRLQKRGWTNQWICSLCRTRPESGIHLHRKMSAHNSNLGGSAALDQLRPQDTGVGKLWRGEAMVAFPHFHPRCPKETFKNVGHLDLMDDLE